jgi:hypothetical protein
MKLHLLILIFLFKPSIEGFCQNNFLSAKTDVRIVEKIDSNISFVTYRIKPINHKNENKNIKTRKIFIDIPKDLKYNSYYYSANTDYFIFENGDKVIIIKNQLKTDSVSIDLNSVVQRINGAAILQQNKIPILYFNKQTGYYIFEKYLVCFFNVKDDNLILFNSSIKSIRKKK